MQIEKDVRLSDYSFWKVGGPADYFCLPSTIEELAAGVQFANQKGLALTILGGGTNVLISDRGIAGLVICMRKLKGLTAREENGRLHVECFAGTTKAEVTREFLKRKLAPALFLCGLPGDMGGGVVMNAGVSDPFQPREFVEITDWIEVFDLEKENVRRIPAKEMEWRYRHTSGWQPNIIVRVGVSWELVPDDSMPVKVKEATRIRISKQPLNLPSGGSTFKNPENSPLSAGALIDKAGLKGYRVGGAEVSTKHANFIVNVEKATASDVHAVITHVQEEVHRQFGVELVTEVKYLGRW